MENPTYITYSDFLIKAKDYKEVKQPDAMEVLNNLLPYVYCKTPYPELLYYADHARSRFSFLISNRNDFLGYSTSYLIDAGPSFIYSLRHPEDFEIFNKDIFPENMSFLKTHAEELISDYRFTTNYRLKSKDGNWINFSHRSCYIFKAEDGTPLAEIVSLTEIDPMKYDSGIIHQIEKVNIKQETTLIRHNILTKREVDVLKLAGDGFCSKQIADKLAVSIHTINNHRKKMLEKTNCKNFPELLKLALKHGIKLE